ncbi:unnamed protein product [Rhizophagus irregularis]|uniref:Uncharacterized protein n=1 Tax=Rhizophagus irregularis TaxID=588596 RepID=A0A2I1HDY7_9GLOM|nr:hypothetical protein RhiirA4_411529 [Rhizophagus irregularis]CAB4418248.1 unnamed protein product [Rhizophagus irregularis]
MENQNLYPELSYGDIGNQGGYGPCTEPQVKKGGENQAYNTKQEAPTEKLTEATVGAVSEGVNKLTGNQEVKNSNEQMKDEPAQPVKEEKKQ